MSVNGGKVLCFWDNKSVTSVCEMLLADSPDGKTAEIYQESSLSVEQTMHTRHF